MRSVEEEFRLLPPNWAFSRIGDITLPVAKIDPQDDPDKNIAYIDISGIDNQANRIEETKFFRLADAPSRAKQIVGAGDVLFSLVRPYLRNIAQVSDELDSEIASTGFAVLRPAEGVDAKFLFFKAISREFVDSLSGEQYGVSYPAVKDAQVRAQPVLLPPTNEQRRIVEKIETLFARLDQGEAALRHTQTLLARYRQSVLKAAVTGALTADWRAENAHRLEHGRDLLARILQTRRETWQGRGKYKEPAAPDTSNLPELPEGWVWASLGQLVSKIEAGKNFRCDERPPEGDEVGVVKISAVTWDTFDELESKTVLRSDQINMDYRIHAGDLLVSRANTLELVGATVVVEKISKSLLLSDKVLRLCCVVSLEYWLNFVLKSPLGRLQIESLATGAQMSMRNIAQKNLERIAIPLPPSNEIDFAIAKIRHARMQSEALAKRCETELTRSAALRQSILKDAFAGKLVPQDPSDEPAADLLARIRASRAAAPKKARGKAHA